MTKRATSGTKKREQRLPPDPRMWARSLYHRGILGLLFVSLAVVTLLALLHITSGLVVDWWSGLLFRTFGWASYFVAIVAVGIGVLVLVGGLLAGRAGADGLPAKRGAAGTKQTAELGTPNWPWPMRDHWHIVIGVEIVFLALLGLMHLAIAGDDPWGAARAGRGGGYVGAFLSGVLSEALGPLPAGLILSGVLIWGAIVASGLTLEQCLLELEQSAYRVRMWLAARLTILASRWPFVPQHKRSGAVAWGGDRSGPPLVQEQQERALQHSTPSPRSAAAAPTDRAYPASQESPAQRAAHRTDASAAASRPRSVDARFPLEPKPSVVRPDKGRADGRSIPLPSLELLEEPDEALFDETDLRNKARAIEETLDHFDVPAKVTEINWGPRVTQFGVEPGYIIRRGQGGEDTERKVRVAKIASLSNDLALALAAAPVRVEAPVPGRSIVGIEVPNREVSRVSLRRVMDSKRFKGRGSGGPDRAALRLALGEGVAGAPIVADLARMPHLLIAGATGSGKSVCINAIATCLLFQNSPYTLRMAMIDPKRVELSAYNGVPHLYGQVESEVERIVGVLRWLVQVMEERYKKFAASGARHLDDYNRHWRVGSSEYLPRIVVLIDELADMMFFAPDEVEHSIIRLAQMARATGMHLVIATQRPSVDVVTGLIKANFPARIGFAVTSNTDSRVILDSVGAESLLSKGDMLYMSPNASGLLRLQGCFVSASEVVRTVGYWKQWAADVGWMSAPGSAALVSGAEKNPWDALLSEQGAEEEADELLPRAIDIVRKQKRASASLLQRRMHIGYPRASRLIDEMEERGIVGPAKSGGRQRQVLVESP